MTLAQRANHNFGMEAKSGDALTGRTKNQEISFTKEKRPELDRLMAEAQLLSNSFRRTRRVGLMLQARATARSDVFMVSVVRIFNLD